MAQHQRSRIVASVAATCIALACGTNYVYSAWAPQFAERLKLSSTQSNLIGLFGNLGMYSMGVPIGICIDTYGPRGVVLAGSILLAIGYFPLHQAYDNAGGSVALLCFFSFLSGLGGCMAFNSAIKTSALNWPSHRGSATAFPLAGFGLSAFFFSLIGSFVFPGDTSGFLMLLSCGTSGITFLSVFFLKVYPVSTYLAVPTDSERPAPLRRTSSEEAKARPRGRGADAGPPDEPGTSARIVAVAVGDLAGVPSWPEEECVLAHASDDVEHAAVDESSSLVSSVGPAGEDAADGDVDVDRSHHVDIRGMVLLKTMSFWQLWSIMAILSGIGLMTINNIGNDAKALWMHFDPSKSEEFLVNRQQMHVSILSIGSFAGRLMSGTGSDVLVKRLHASRVWCLILSCLAFLVAQVCAINVSNPNFLSFVSGLSGIGYGFLFGVFPSIVAETFGIRGLSQNWGFMTLAPVLSSNIFNLFYGVVYDQHSVVEPGGERACHQGLECYRAAYWVTLVAGAAGLLATLWVIRHQHLQHLRGRSKGAQED